MTSDIDTYRAAKLLVDRYGDGATVEAIKRADALAAQGDAAGKVVWLRILEAVHEPYRAGTLNHDSPPQALEAPEGLAKGRDLAP